jgi:hypothetical protein
MALLSFGLLSLAVLFGMVLAVLRVRPGGGRTRARIGLLHGGIGAVGVVAMLLALRHAVLGALAWDAVALLVAALLGGATWYVWVRRGRPPEMILVLHGALAFIGYALLAACVGTL